MWRDLSEPIPSWEKDSPPEPPERDLDPPDEKEEDEYDGQ